MKSWWKTSCLQTTIELNWKKCQDSPYWPVLGGKSFLCSLCEPQALTTAAAVRKNEETLYSHCYSPLFSPRPDWIASFCPCHWSLPFQSWRFLSWRNKVGIHYSLNIQSEQTIHLRCVLQQSHQSNVNLNFTISICSTLCFMNVIMYCHLKCEFTPSSEPNSTHCIILKNAFYSFK